MNWSLSNHRQASPYRGLCQIEDIPKAPGNILNLIQRPKMRLTKKPSCAALPRTAICTSRCCSARWPSTKKCRPRPDCDSQSNHHSQTVMTGFWSGPRLDFNDDWNWAFHIPIFHPNAFKASSAIIHPQPQQLFLSTDLRPVKKAVAIFQKFL